LNGHLGISDREGVVERILDAVRDRTNFRLLQAGRRHVGEGYVPVMRALEKPK